MKRESEVQIVVRIFICSVRWLKNVKEVEMSMYSG